VSASVALPIVCAWCERVRNGSGRWEETDAPPVADHATHGICPDCLVTQKREASSHALECI
jgi:hypothetical protein